MTPHHSWNQKLRTMIAIAQLALVGLLFKSGRTLCYKDKLFQS